MQSSMTKPKPEDIVVVTLDAHRLNEDKGLAFETFKKLPVKDKIALFIRKIEEDYPVIKSQHPDAKTIIFVAREYAIQGVDRRSISVEEKQTLHDAMMQVTKDKSDLVVIPGPVLIRKKIKPDDEKKLLSYIKPHEWVKNREDPGEDDKKGIYHVEKDLQQFSLFADTEKYKNTAYVYAGGLLVGRIGKIAVRNEPELEPTKGVTQLAKKKSLERTLTLPNGLVIGIDICNDHNHGLVLKQGKPVDIHFILSDENFVILPFIKGLSVHVDGTYRSDMYLPQESKGSPAFYRHNILTESKLAKGEPIYPLQFFMRAIESLLTNKTSEDLFARANLEIRHFMQYQQQLNELLQRAKLKNPDKLEELKAIQNRFYELIARYGLHKGEIELLKYEAIKFEVPETKEDDEDTISDEELLEDFTAAFTAGGTDKDLADFLQPYLNSYGLTIDTALGRENHTIRSLLIHYEKSAVIPLLAPEEEVPSIVIAQPRRKSL